VFEVLFRKGLISKLLIMTKSFCQLSLLSYLLLGFLCCTAFGQTPQSSGPAVVSAVAPVYPVVFMALKIEGEFNVDVEIDKDGKVVSSESVNENRKWVTKVIEETADRWRFAPDKDSRSNRRARLTFVFRYMPEAKGFDVAPIFYPPYKVEVRDNTVILSN
jgi:hypothetical protein